jgi:hypothetical protein
MMATLRRIGIAVFGLCVAASLATTCDQLTIVIEDIDDIEEIVDIVITDDPCLLADPPVLDGVPEDIEINEGDEIPDPPEVTATDFAGDDLEVDFTETDIDDDCPNTTMTLLRTWTATDSCDNATSATQRIDVLGDIVDDTPPEISDVPDDLTVACDSIPEPAEVIVEDDFDPNPTVEVGEVRVDLDAEECPAIYQLVRTWTATDDCGNSSSVSQTITVEDNGPYVINSLEADPAELWPPNHEFVAVEITVDADECDDRSVCTIVSVESNEAVNERGDGNTSPDWEFTGEPDDLIVNLRSERAGGGDGREYTVTVECRDVCNDDEVAQEIVVVSVPHDQGN